jgi:hypothetical protein
VRKNLNTPDRLIRALVLAPAAIVVALLVGAGSAVGIVMLVLAALMLATSAVSFCPLYALLHLDTRGRQQPLSH